MFQAIRNNLTFFRNFRTRFETTGSILPSSRFLGKSMSRFLAKRGDGPLRVLEIGPGTGPVTSEIVRHLKPGDCFDLVELNEEFVDVLKKRFETEAAWSAVKDVSHIHQLPLQEFQFDEKYDIVISGLPFANFPGELVQQFVDQYAQLVKPGGTISYFEYMFIRPIKTKVSWGKSRGQIQAVDAVVREFCRKYEFCRDNVFLNVPPAWVHHLRVGEE